MTDISDSVVLIASTDNKNRRFGSGFVIHSREGKTWILTCAHVVEHVGGIEQLRVACGEDLFSAIRLDACGASDEIDLAVLEVADLELSPLSLCAIGKAKMPFRINGYRNYSGSRYVKRPLDGFLGDSITFAAPGKTSVSAWDLSIEDDYGLAGGYSGSPVTSKESGAVFAVASHAEVKGERGQAISISCLSKIWPDMPADMVQEKQIPAEPAFMADLDILPYLVNRQEQDKKLDKAIAAHPDWQTPLICMIHGNDADCPDSFLDRLQLCTLPVQIRGQSHRGIAVTRCDCMDFSSRKALHDEMRRDLSYKLHDKGDAGNKEIALALAEKSRPVIVWTQIYTSDLQTCGEAAIEWFISFWKDWPRINAQNHLLLACLAFCYHPEPPKRFLFFKRAGSSLNTQVQTKLDTLDFAAIQTPGVVLPQLNLIQRKHTEIWIEEYARKTSCNPFQLRQHIKTRFPDPGVKMPMQEVAESLGELLRKCTAQGITKK